MKKVVFDKAYNQMLRLQHAEVHFPTKFKMFSIHNGIRRGKLHLFIGTSGGGKSTLVRSIVKDLMEEGMDFDAMGIWLSEEKVSEFQTEFSKINLNEHISNEIFIESELEIEEDNYMEIRFIEFIKQNQLSVLIFDNLTTSTFYMDKRPEEQARFAKVLSKVAADINIPIIIIAHTSALVHDNMPRLININDIRGSKTIINLTQFQYIMQRFKIGERFFPMVMVEKHRGHSVTKSMFQLVYDEQQQIFTHDKPVDFERFRELFKLRNSL